MQLAPSPAIPFFGARAYARQLALEVEKLKVERDTAQAKAQELTTIAQNLVADSKAIQAEHQNALRQLKAIGGLSIVEIDDRRRLLQTEVDALKAQLVQERAEIEVAQRSLKARRGPSDDSGDKRNCSSAGSGHL
jgi:FtsZ-binding cell division protein ZapB